MMTIQDVMELFIDNSFQMVYIWNIKTEEEIYRGYYEDMPEELAGAEICSIDNITGGEKDYIGFNVEV